ncbi:tRNA (adenosine(37)-N6)-dimethylallyltransferase MiaA [Symbiobacterium terraclitae]|uniref:tRNA (adenosine(37)-N6)-dimethylallyltransferase MiaA n=1 Tax=Symbiobacterium terraclitae TaxID=557451 RepID=UPI0035B55F5C
MKLPLLVLVGPTAVGKTALSVAVAQEVGAEIISGDSMQVYRGMDVGTAKITQEEMGGVPHHLIDIKDPDEEFSVAEFQARVDRLVRAIHARGRLPMLVGGTGLYVRAVVEDYTFTELEPDPELRQRLREEEARNGPGYLHARLAEVDPVSASRLHPNDIFRIVRALEVYRLTGVPISATQTAAASEPRYDDLMIGLTMDRQQLYARIDERVDAMLAAGWLDEVKRLLHRYPPHLRPMEALGYRELVLYLRGMLTWAEAVALIKRNTRRFAKRQFTWFRRERRLIWLDVTTPEARNRARAEVVRLVKEKWP